MTKKKERPKYIAMRDLALQQLKSGQSLTGKGGIFEPIVKEFLENALAAEMDAYLDEEESQIKSILLILFVN